MLGKRDSTAFMLLQLQQVWAVLHWRMPLSSVGFTSRTHFGIASLVMDFLLFLDLEAQTIRSLAIRPDNSAIFFNADSYL